MKEMKKRKIILYLELIYKLGGIETWLYNLTSILKDDFDFLVLWGAADPDQLARLQVPHEQYDPAKKYECDILLNMINGRPTSVRARHVVQMVHANYSELLATYRYVHWNMTDSYIFVSKAAERCFTGPIIGYESAVLTNPVYVPEGIRKTKTRSPKKLKIMAATRLTAEKGGGRLVQLVRQIHEAGIPVEMHIWTNWDFLRFNRTYDMKELRPYFYFHEPTLNLYPEMAKFDYVAQLSDCESFCYTIHESLAVHTPVLVTDWKGVRDYVRNGLNGFIYDMDMNGPNPKALLNRPNVFGVADNENSENWKKYLQRLPLLHEIKPDRHWYFK